MDLSSDYIISNTDFSNLTLFELLKHVDNASFIDHKDFKDIYALSLELNSGVFTKNDQDQEFPTVVVSQIRGHIVTSCTCGNVGNKMCEHQGIVCYAILENNDFRLFFDEKVRNKALLQIAKSYGLEDEPYLDNFFIISFEEGELKISPSVVGLLKTDNLSVNSFPIIPIRKSRLAILSEQHRRRILVISKHRYYNQLNVLLMEAERTKSGKIKNPIDAVDTQPLIWNSNDPKELKFYSAVHYFQNKYSDDSLDLDLDALKLIINNPLSLDIFFHDRSISETISSKSLKPITLDVLKAEVQLTVFKKSPFYEITGELIWNETSLHFKQLQIKNEYFLLHKNGLYLIGNPDLLRVIKFFKSNNEIIVLHESKYDEFFRNFLEPLEQLVKINYSFIRQATPSQLKDKNYELSRLIYLQQEGSYVSITPVMKYGDIEVPVYSRKQIFDTDPNGNVFSVERNHDAEERLTASILDKHPEFLEQLEEKVYFYLHKDKFLDEGWFIETFEQWREEDIAILGFNDIEKNKINPNRAKISIEVISGIDWFNAKLKVGFDQQTATLRQIHRAIRNKSKFVALDDGTFGILPEEWITKIGSYFKIGDMDEEMITIPKVNYSEVEDLFEKDILSDEVQQEIDLLKEEFSAGYQIPKVKVPKSLNAELRTYQHEGLNWLCFLDKHNFGGCLADDMGLGKTLQIIAFILSQREKYPNQTNLIVMPTSIMFNWEEEIQKFAPSIKIWKHYGSDRNKHTDGFEDYEVILTTYGIMLSDIRFLKKFRFNYIFLDESQAIKNPNSERYKAARLLNARNRIVLTGTPVENNTFDLYGQLSFASPGLLGSKQFFKDTYALPIDKFDYSKRANGLQEKIKPFVLRRTKKQVATELPEKTEMVIYCEMNAEQRRIYETYETEIREFISAKDEDEIQKNSMHVLTGLTKLRQICNSPVLLKEGHAAENAVKIEVILEQIENKSKEHKILIFSQFVGMLDLIKAELENREIPFEYLTGQSKDRGEKVHNFQSNDDVRVFLISLKAGGVGLNLTEADYVYLIDPWWNPAAENQAIDRAYRIGQNKHVVAVRMICSDTIEEKIMKLQMKKRKLAQDLIQTDASFFGSLSKDDLLEIL